MYKLENKSKYIGFSYFKKILQIKNISFEFETFFSDIKNTNDKYNLYFFYKDKNILHSSLHNLIFILKNFEKDLFSINLFILKEILKTIDLKEFKENIEKKPNSEFLRKIGFLLEIILEKDIQYYENFIVKKTYIKIYR